MPTTTSTMGSNSDDFTDAEAHQIVHLAETQSWQTAAHDYMRSLNQRAYRLVIDEYRSQIRFLLPLSAESRVLNLRSDWGAVAFNLATHVSAVIAMDDRRTRSRFVSARRSQMGVQTLHPVCGSLFSHLPFIDETFDAVITLDAIENVTVTNGDDFKAVQHAALIEVKRVLRTGGWALLGVTNRLGLARRRGAIPQSLRSYWGYRDALEKAGFTELLFHVPLPSHDEPFFILPFDRPHLLKYFVNKMFKAQDYRSKLEARGLGQAYRIASTLQRVAQHSGILNLARYFVPSFLILARK